MVTKTIQSRSAAAGSAARRKALTFSSLLTFLVILVPFILGLGVRFFDLTDQPLDFHPTRQLRAALMARGMYYQKLPDADPAVREDAIRFGNSVGQYEPPFLEQLVASTYLLLGEETLWVSRIYTSLFWVIGGAALLALAYRVALNEQGEQEKQDLKEKKISPWIPLGAALIVLAYYLFLPFGVQASRSFQPDPGMVMWIVLSVWSLYRWSETRSWKWAILAGLFGGIGVLVKVVAAYLVGAAAVALVLYTLGLKRFWRSLQVWVMAALMITPSGIYYLVENQGRAADYFASWTLSLSHLLLDPALYVRWLNLVQSLMGLGVLLVALVGVLIAASRSKALLVGLWAGYAIYGLFLPYQMYTHNYYHLQLIPIIALSLVPVIQLLLARLSSQPKLWQALFIGIVLVGVVFPAWQSIAEQKREDHRIEPAYWQEIASYLPTDGKILGLTQDYGFRLMYYGWRKVVLWPNRGELNLAAMRGNEKQFENFFAKRIEGKDYFLVTAFGQFNSQPDLKQTLNERYPVYAEGDGYLIYDLAHPLEAAAP